MGAKTAKILVVDDITDNYKTAANILQHGGYTCMHAANGQAAVDFCRDNQVDLILMDIMMPIMDGHEACRAIKTDSRYAEVPIIFLTAVSDIENMGRAFTEGGVDYLVKPFNRSELLARVGTHLALRDAQLAQKALIESLSLKNRELEAKNQYLENISGLILEYEAKPLEDMDKALQYLQAEVTDNNHLLVVKRLVSLRDRMTTMLSSILKLSQKN